MTQQEYEQRKRECWGEYLSEYKTTYTRTAFDFAFDRAYALGKQEGPSKNSSEIKRELSKNSSESTPAEPKFKVGDKVRILTHLGEDTPLKGEVLEIVDMDESDPICTYYLDDFSGRWYSESDLEPYTEPKEEADKQFDNILKDSFSKERRLNIATQMVSAYIHCEGMTDPSYIATIAFQLADALIAESEKEDSK